MDMVKQIMRTFWLTRKKIGIAWLKDKHALAKQRVCFHGNDVKKIGENNFLQQLDKIAWVVQTGYSEIPLGLHSQITNQFWIRLKYPTKVSAEYAEKLAQTFKQLMEKWFPNYFGEQRFGVTASNHRIAQDILDGWRKHFTQSEKMFKLQWYSSRLFNKYLEHRAKIYDGIHLLEWDIVINPNDPYEYVLSQGENTFATIQGWKEKWFFVEAVANKPISFEKAPWITGITWPLVWFNTLLSPKDTPAWSYEQGRIKHFELTEDHLHLYKPYNLFGLRRSLWVIPTNSSFKRQWNDLLLQFTLPKSAYASVVVELLTQE